MSNEYINLWTWQKKGFDIIKSEIDHNKSSWINDFPKYSELCKELSERLAYKHGVFVLGWILAKQLMALEFVEGFLEEFKYMPIFSEFSGAVDKVIDGLEITRSNYRNSFHSPEILLL